MIAYASARGIRVVPEFDMPGHSTSWMVGYPNLGSAPSPYSVQTSLGIFDSALDPTRNSTYQVFDAFLGEIARRSSRLQQTSDRMSLWPKLGTAGLQTLNYPVQKAPAPSEWHTAQKRLLNQTAQHKEMVDFAVLPAIENLIEAASENQSIHHQPYVKRICWIQCERKQLQ